jgi:hypothetical protein
MPRARPPQIHDVMRRLLLAAWCAVARRLPPELASRVCRRAFGPLPEPPPPACDPGVSRGDFNARAMELMSDPGAPTQVRVERMLRHCCQHPAHVRASPRLLTSVMQKVREIRAWGLAGRPGMPATTVDAAADCLRTFRRHPCQSPLCLNPRSKARPNRGLCAAHLRQALGRPRRASRSPA